MIIIPMKNGYFIGNINPTFSDIPCSNQFPGCDLIRVESLADFVAQMFGASGMEWGLNHPGAMFGAMLRAYSPGRTLPSVSFGDWSNQRSWNDWNGFVQEWGCLMAVAMWRNTMGCDEDLVQFRTEATRNNKIDLWKKGQTTTVFIF